CSSYAGSGVFF
nr:immunoglobulin light chain junction region [Macaca mulatta]